MYLIDSSSAKSAASSMERTDVVPTAITRLPLAFVAKIASIASGTSNIFSVHFMIFNPFYTHRLKGSRAYVQGDKGKTNPFGF